MHIAHILASLADEASGPTYSVTRLAQTLAAQGNRVSLLSTGVQQETRQGGLHSRVFPPDQARVPILGRLRASRGLRAAVDGEAAAGAVLHAHGLWLMPNLYPAWSARAHRRPLVVSPRGMLGAAALAFSRRKKRLMWALAQKQALQAAACLHATSAQERDEIRAAGLTNPVAVIANGIDVPELPLPPPLPPGAPRTVLHLGRLHPKKGIDRLLHAWAKVEPAHPGWRLQIAGPSENGYGAELAALAQGLALARVTFTGPLYGEEKRAAYRAAGVFVLPTLNENFGLVVAEALASGTPVICSKGAPWQGLESERCGWWVDHGPEPLAAALDRAMRLPPAELSEMGGRGRRWMQRDFSWESVASQMSDVYRWCAGAGPLPATVSGGARSSACGAFRPARLWDAMERETPP